MAGLLVAFVPMLLILVTVGLGRLEIWLGHDTVTSTDVAEFLQRAQRPELRALAQEGMTQALDCLNRRRSQVLSDARTAGSYTGKHHAAPFLVAVFSEAVERGLPTRPNVYSPVSSPVTPTRHVNHV